MYARKRYLALVATSPRQAEKERQEVPSCPRPLRSLRVPLPWCPFIHSPWLRRRGKVHRSVFVCTPRAKIMCYSKSSTKDETEGTNQSHNLFSQEFNERQGRARSTAKVIVIPSAFSDAFQFCRFLSRQLLHHSHHYCPPCSAQCNVTLSLSDLSLLALSLSLSWLLPKEVGAMLFPSFPLPVSARMDIYLCSCILPCIQYFTLHAPILENCN